jgi:hypothetical protein
VIEGSLRPASTSPILRREARPCTLGLRVSTLGARTFGTKLRKPSFFSLSQFFSRRHGSSTSNKAPFSFAPHPAGLKSDSSFSLPSGHMLPRTSIPQLSRRSDTNALAMVLYVPGVRVHPTRERRRPTSLYNPGACTRCPRTRLCVAYKSCTLSNMRTQIAPVHSPHI